MTDKKIDREKEEGKEDNFTGSPKQQLPDLEAEDIPGQPEEKENEGTDTDNPEDR